VVGGVPEPGYFPSSSATGRETEAQKTGCPGFLKGNGRPRLFSSLPGIPVKDLTILSGAAHPMEGQGTHLG
jgi:hypothetical protein